MFVPENDCAKLLLKVTVPVDAVRVPRLVTVPPSFKSPASVKFVEPVTLYAPLTSTVPVPMLIPPDPVTLPDTVMFLSSVLNVPLDSDRFPKIVADAPSVTPLGLFIVKFGAPPVENSSTLVVVCAAAPEYSRVDDPPYTNVAPVDTESVPPSISRVPLTAKSVASPLLIDSVLSVGIIIDAPVFIVVWSMVMSPSTVTFVFSLIVMLNSSESGGVVACVQGSEPSAETSQLADVLQSHVPVWFVR